MVRVGCSGWQYKHWKGDFYPADLREASWLDHYLRRFDTVELNNSFYRLPEAATFRSWRERTPASFLFAVKASRFLTHMKKLKDPEEPLQRFFERARELGDRLGPVLYQLPPRWPVNLERLDAFLACLPEGTPRARVPRALVVCPEVLERLERAGRGALPARHGRLGLAARPRRSARLRSLPRRHPLRRPLRRRGAHRGPSGSAAEHAAGRDVFAYFNNDIGGHAPRDAIRLREMLGG
jgi:uncharacterized protein YecE (DUF72 family)